MCQILRDDGITYQEYAAELTYLLFLKMMKETGTEKTALPECYRWRDLVLKEGDEQLKFYRTLLACLGTIGKGHVQAIFKNAKSSLKNTESLLALVTDIDGIAWYDPMKESLGDIYEDILEKNASERKSGAGQYFTPRPLIQCMVNCVKPQLGEIIQDPAAGTGGFLTRAAQYMKANTGNSAGLSNEEKNFQKQDAFYAVELVDDTYRLLLMNMLLHGMEGTYVAGDTMGGLGKNLPEADVVFANPPFGTKHGGTKPTRDDFSFPTGNKPLAFLQHVYRSLKPAGRAAIVLPDNVLFEKGIGTEIRSELMDKCNLHTILRLPIGIFRAKGIKANVLFFTRGESDNGNTKDIWFYDLRTNLPSVSKRLPLTHVHFLQFEKCYGENADGTSKRVDQGEESRFRCFTREFVSEQNNNLVVNWLKDETTTGSNQLGDPTEVVSMIRDRLRNALGEMDALAELLDKMS